MHLTNGKSKDLVSYQIPGLDVCQDLFDRITVGQAFKVDEYELGFDIEANNVHHGLHWNVQFYLKAKKISKTCAFSFLDP